MGTRYGFRVGRSAVTRVFVEPDDEAVLVGSPFLKPWAEIPYDAIATVVHQQVIEPDPAFYAGRPRQLDLVPQVGANVVIVLRQSVRLTGFTFGAEKGISITAKERRQGVEVDVITTTVGDPAALVEDLRAHGVAVGDSVPGAKRSAYGHAVGDELVQLQRSDRRSRMGIVAYGGAISLGLLVGLPILADSVGLDDGEAFHTGAIVGGIAVATVIAGCTAVLVQRAASPSVARPVDTRRVAVPVVPSWRSSCSCWWPPRSASRPRWCSTSCARWRSRRPSASGSARTLRSWWPSSGAARAGRNRSVRSAEGHGTAPTGLPPGGNLVILLSDEDRPHPGSTRLAHVVFIQRVRPSTSPTGGRRSFRGRPRHRADCRERTGRPPIRPHRIAPIPQGNPTPWNSTEAKPSSSRSRRRASR